MSGSFHRGLAAAFLACVASPLFAAEVHPLLPAETETAFHVNFRQIIDSQLIRKLALEQMKQALQGADAQRVMTDLGLDPLKDIDELTVGFWAEDPKVPSGLAILSGKFDPAKLFNAADVESKRNGDRIEIVTEGKYKFVRVSFENPDGNANPRRQPFKEIFVSVPSNAMILASTDKELLAKTMERVEKKDSKPAVRKALGALIVKMDDGASLYFCSLSDPKKVGDVPPNPLFADTEALKKQLQKIETTSMSLRVGDDVGLELSIGMKDGEAAEEFGDTVDDMLGKVKSFLPLLVAQSPKMKPVVDDVSKNLTCKTKGKEVQLTLVLSGKSIAAVLESDD